MKQAINTRTQEEYDALMRYYKSQGIDYSEPEREGEKIWEIDKEQTCISVWIDGSLVYGNVEFYKMRHVSIIPYTEFAKANIVEEPDYKALYLEGRELLEKLSRINKDKGVAGSTWGDTDYDSLSAVFGYNLCLENIQWEIKAFLAKHNDHLTNHKDGE